MKTTKRALPLAALGCAVVLTAASLAASTMAQAQAQAQVQVQVQVQAQTLRPVDVARGLDHPWSLAFLPDGRMLVTERAGRLRIVAAAGQVSPPVAGLPPVAASGQCGLLDVVLDPRFAENQRIYWSYAEAGEGGNSTAVARGRLQDGRVDEVQLLFRQQPKVASSQHCGGRLVFARDGRLFVTLGDRFSRKEDAQNLANHLGKIVRIEADGRVPADNPFAGRPGAAAEIWSLGHRNVQGAALHPDTGELWASEHGPQGGDEINLIEGGRNYGWPLLTFGRNYGTGTRIGEEGPKPGFEQPLKTWVPISIAPSGMAFLTSERYPGWKGSLFIGALRDQALHRLTLEGRRVVADERLLTNLNERIRDVRQGPDGWLYILTDSPDGRVIRLER
jgi:glucose/arabinose dehydrogenase